MATATKRKRKNAGRDTFKKSFTNFNDRLVNTSETVIDETFLTAEKYQKLFAKTVKNTEPIVEKQVNMVFDTLEEIKDQYQNGANRFRKLIGWKEIKKNTEKRIKDIRKNAEERVEAIQDEVMDRAKAMGLPVKEEAKKKTTKKVAAKAVTTKTDLQVVDGIGPKMEKVLMAGGIDKLSVLANTEVSKIEGIIEASGVNLRGANIESWIEQAKKASK